MQTVRLGDRAKDKLTGFTGIVTGITEFLTGCKRVALQPEKLIGGKVNEALWFDEPHVELVKSSIHAPVNQSQGGSNLNPPARPLYLAGR